MCLFSYLLSGSYKRKQIILPRSVIEVIQEEISIFMKKITTIFISFKAIYSRIRNKPFVMKHTRYSIRHRTIIYIETYSIFLGLIFLIEFISRYRQALTIIRRYT